MLQESDLMDLLQRVRADDRNAANELIEVCCERVRQLASAQLRKFPGVRRWEETDDIAQRVFVKVAEAASRRDYESAEHFYRSTATVIRNQMIDLARHYCGAEGMGANHASRSPESGIWDGGEGQLPDPVSLVEWSEIHETIGTLSDESRQMFELIYYHGLSTDAAGEVLDISPRQARRRWRSAREEFAVRDQANQFGQ